MSFISILKTIGTDAEKVMAAAAPMVGAFNPAAGALMTMVSAGVVQAEQLFPEPQSGPRKKNLVMTNFESAIPLIQLGIQIDGGAVVNSADFTTKASDVVDKLSAYLESVAALTAVVQAAKTK